MIFVAIANQNKIAIGNTLSKMFEREDGTMGRTLAEVITEGRKNKGLSQREAAIRMEVSNSTWARWESGEVTPHNIETLFDIAEVLDLSPFYLIVLVCPRFETEVNKVVHQIFKEQ